MKDRSGKTFEERVADVYRALGYKVTPNIDRSGGQTDLVAEKEIPGASKIVLVVECKDHSRAISNTMVDAFVNRVAAQTRSGFANGGVMVSGKGFTSKARAVAAEQHDIALLSLSELTAQIFNIGVPLRELVERYEGQEIFRDYRPLKVESQDWSAGAKSSSPAPFDGLMNEMIGFDGRHGIGLILVLADFGAGKTTLLRNIEYHRAKAHLAGEDPRVPLFVPLRDFRESQDVGVLLQTSFRNAYYRELPLGVLWQRIESGNFYLLLDGFDEMVDRSDSGRRLELFQGLLPVLRSRSPALLTSRPSYLVERGELRSLLASLRDERGPAQAPIVGGSHEKVVAEQMRRKLSERMREASAPPGIPPALNPNLVRVVRLTSLDVAQVKEFVALHADDLAEVHASTGDLLEFIDRTYDLSDLATRPMLLRLIVNTVQIGAIDLSDTSTQYGASGLYEIYTHHKLDSDLEKIRGAATGLDVDTRRRLAETLALEMFRARTLETDFHEHLRRLVDNDPRLRAALDRSGLTEEEIATDLAARSFVTVDDGVCRFIHKSFRGFFVARVLKEQLPELDQMFDESLEDEVLYFLGGFAPTEKNTGQALWRSYRETDPVERARRRNLVVAILHTKPNFTTERFEDAEIVEAEFGRLQFVGTQFNDIEWRDIDIDRIDLTKATWTGVRFVESRVGEILVEGSQLGLRVVESEFESWTCVKTAGSIEGARSTIEHWELEASSISAKLTDGLNIKKMILDRSRLTLEDVKTERTESGEIEKVEMASSRLAIRGETSPAVLQARDSVVVCTSPSAIQRGWNLKNSILQVSPSPLKKPSHPENGAAPATDAESLILAADGASLPLLHTRAGVFGSFDPTPEETTLLDDVSAWGVLQAENLLATVKLPRKYPGCKLGDLLLMKGKRYRELTEDKLSAPRNLTRFVDGPKFDPTDSDSLKELHSLRRTARAQYDALLPVDWPDLADFLSSPS